MKGSRGVPFVIVLLFCLIITPIAHSAPAWCDAADVTFGQTSKKAVFGYAQRTGDYCDGQTLVPSSGGLEVIGYAYSSAITGALGSTVYVNAVQPQGSELTHLSPQTRIRGVMNDLHGDYKLDGELPESQSALRVGMESALSQLHLDVSAISFVAWKESPALGRVYLPSFISSVPEQGASGVPIFKLRTTNTIASIRATVRIPVTGDTLAELPRIAKTQHPGDLIEMPISFASPHGIYELLLQATLTNGMQTSTPVVFLKP